MQGIVLLSPNQQMCRIAEKIIREENYKIDYVKQIHSMDTVSEARQVIAQGANIIIARGYQAGLIKDFTNVPVVEIVMTGQEMSLLIMQAKKIVNKAHPYIAVIGFDNMLCDMTHFNKLFDVELKICKIRTFEEIKNAVDQLVAEKIDIIIGVETAVDAAEKAGIPAIPFLSTEDSIRQAFKNAEKIKYASNLEKRNYAQITTLLDYSFMGSLDKFRGSDNLDEQSDGRFFAEKPK